MTYTIYVSYYATKIMRLKKFQMFVEKQLDIFFLPFYLFIFIFILAETVFYTVFTTIRSYSSLRISGYHIARL
jgi:hypothetical protein